MKISLIGMSNAGKTTISKRLIKHGFTIFSCDDFIEKKLENELKKNGYKGISDVALWMGHPYEEKYKQTSETYIQLEEKSMHEILDIIEKVSEDKNIVIDTTGSVIYLSKNIKKRLFDNTKVIYIETPQSAYKEMFETFLNEPKPLIWGNMFDKHESESVHDAFYRCYPALLKWRAKAYKKIAHDIISVSKLRHSGGLDHLLSIINS